MTSMTDARSESSPVPTATCLTCLTSLRRQLGSPPGTVQDQVQITCAMNLLQAGVDTSSIALWLGHSGTKAVQVYLHADLTLKEQTLARTAPDAPAARRYRPPDRLLAFLEGL